MESLFFWGVTDMVSGVKKLGVRSAFGRRGATRAERVVDSGLGSRVVCRRRRGVACLCLDGGCTSALSTSPCHIKIVPEETEIGQGCAPCVWLCALCVTTPGPILRCPLPALSEWHRRSARMAPAHIDNRIRPTSVHYAVDASRNEATLEEVQQ